MEQLMQQKFAKVTEVLGENPSQHDSVHHKSHMTQLPMEHGPAQ
jgi:hypothetical protein